MYYLPCVVGIPAQGLAYFVDSFDPQPLPNFTTTLEYNKDWIWRDDLRDRETSHQW